MAELKVAGIEPTEESPKLLPHYARTGDAK